MLNISGSKNLIDVKVVYPLKQGLKHFDKFKASVIKKIELK